MRSNAACERDSLVRTIQQSEGVWTMLKFLTIPEWVVIGTVTYLAVVFLIVRAFGVARGDGDFE